MKPMIRNVFQVVCLIFIVFNKSILAQSVQLAWTSTNYSNLSHFGIYRTTHPDSSFELINTVPYPDTIYADNKMQWGIHYYYVATSIDKSGNESNFSNMIDTLLSSNSPVELISFSASLRNDNDVVLTWLTATETNNYGFELQRSDKNANNFQKIGFVMSEGTIAKPKHYTFADNDLASVEYFYRLKQIDLNGSFQILDTIQVTVGTNKLLKLYQNNPNPFNSTTLIAYDLPQHCQVELIVYNIQGQEVIKLVDDFQEAGSHAVDWSGKNNDGKEVGSGLFYYKLKTANETKLRQMLLLR